MPGGRASHKGTSAKPNVNANGLTNAADDTDINPQEVVSNRSDSTRTDEAQVNPAAVERPHQDEQE